MLEIGAYPDCVDPERTAEIHGSRDVEILGDDVDFLLAEDFLGAVAGIVGPAPSVVEYQAFFGGAFLEEIFFHGFGFVVAEDAVVAAQNQLVDFSGCQKFIAHFEAVCEDK